MTFILLFVCQTLDPRKITLVHRVIGYSLPTMEKSNSFNLIMSILNLADNVRPNGLTYFFNYCNSTCRSSGYRFDNFQGLQ